MDWLAYVPLAVGGAVGLGFVAHVLWTIWRGRR